ncbi:MAG TPA: hypothetical protein VGM38_10540 [Pseudolysinimonas sp.]
MRRSVLRYFYPLNIILAQKINIMDKDTIPSLRIKKKCLKVFSRMGIIATSSKLYPGTVEISPLSGTLIVDKRGQHENSQANIHKARTGLPTASSMKNMRKCMDVFQMGLVKSRSTNPRTQRAGYVKAGFWTFTIPDSHTMLDSREGYHSLLKHMIEFLVYHSGMTRYIWRFERQDRGQAHWHICINKYCELHLAKTYWLYLLGKNGLTRDYYEKFDFDPSSACVVEGIMSDNELAFYFSKYFNKKTQSDKPTSGRWWGADLVTKKMPLPLLPITDRFSSNLEVLSKAGTISVQDVEIDIIRKGQEHLPESVRKVDKMIVCTKIWPKKIPMKLLLCPVQRGIYDRYISFNQAGNVEGAVGIRNEVLGYHAEVERWVRDICSMKEDMAFLGRLKEIGRVSKPRLSDRGERRKQSAAVAAEAREAQLALGLYT